MGRADILIVGQGLAGTLLGWELEKAGISVALIDGGHASAASSVAAGIINPITGRRLVKSWSFETLFPSAREAYHELENLLGIALWREMRIRRVFADERERAIAADPKKRASPVFLRLLSRFRRFSPKRVLTSTVTSSLSTGRFWRRGNPAPGLGADL